MSTDSVIRFLKMADENPDLQDRLEGALGDEENAVAAFLEAAKDHGFEFTADEFLDALTAAGIGEKSGELKDEDLEAVAGGLSFGSLRVRGLASRAGLLIGRYRRGPGIGGVGRGGVMQSEEEEELIQM